MRKRLIFLLIVAFSWGCSPQNERANQSSVNEEFGNLNSQIDQVENLDTIKNIYSNFVYRVAFDAPDSWKTDGGVSEHTIFRAFEPDSTITFSINVIENEQDDQQSGMDIWDYYQENKEEADRALVQSMESQINLKIFNYSRTKTHLRNNTTLRTSFDYIIKNQDFEFDLTTIIYSTLIRNLNYTFTLAIPTIFYSQKKEYYEGLFGNIYFLNDEELVNQTITKILYD